MSVDVSAQTVISRPRADVAAYVSDPRNDTRWIGGIREVKVLTEGIVGPGSRVARTAAFLGRKIEYVNEIDRLEPGAVLEMHSVKGPFPMQITYEFEDANDRATLVRLRVRGDATGFYRLASPLLAGQVKRSITKDLASLKRQLESNGTV